MIGRQQPTNAPRTLPGDGLLQVGTWIGSVVFGWASAAVARRTAHCVYGL
jgi:hypothetical protein